MPTDRDRDTSSEPHGRDALGQRGGGASGVDGRSWGARRYRELAADLAAHLGNDVTAPQEAVIRRAAQLQVWCEEREAAFARGEAFDIAEYTTAANAMRRLRR